LYELSIELLRYRSSGADLAITALIPFEIEVSDTPYREPQIPESHQKKFGLIEKW